MQDYEKEHERQAFKAMNFKEKLEHIATYYWVPILVTLFGLFVIGWCINHYILNPPPETGLEFCLFAGYIDSEDCDSFKSRINQEYREQLGEKIFTIAEVQDFGNDPIYYEQIQTSVTQIIAMVNAKELDCIISTESNMLVMSVSEYFLPLTDVFTAYELKLLSEKLSTLSGRESVILYAPINNDSEELFPVALCLEGVSSIEELFTAQFGPYLAFVGSGEHLELARQVVFDLISTEAYESEASD